MPTITSAKGTLNISQEELEKLRQIEEFAQDTQDILKSSQETIETTSEAFTEIASKLKEIQEGVKEISTDFEGSVRDLTNMTDALKEAITAGTQGKGLVRESISLARGLTRELQKQLAIRDTGEGLTQKSVEAGRRALVIQKDSIRALAKAYNEEVAGVVGNNQLSNFQIQKKQIEDLNFDLSDIEKKLKERSKNTPDSDKASKLENLAKTAHILDTARTASDSLKDSLEGLDKALRQSYEDIGTANGKLDNYAKLARKAGLGGVADIVTSTKSQATAAYNRTYLDTEGSEKVKSEKAKEAYNRVVGELGGLPGILKLANTEIKTALTSGTVALGLAVAIFRHLLKFDEEAVKTKRIIGQWADASAVANTRFVTGTEVLQTMNQLGQQFKINPVQVFTSQELAAVAQAQKLTGMTAEAAGNLAVQSKISGQNANRYRDAIAAGANSANALNHSAVNLSTVQNDVLTTSRAIALSYGNSTEALARASGAAAALNMNLQDVENISKNLINFQSSIESEMQAQLLTGMQLNLAKAREYALNNNLEGVLEEIGKQGVTAAKFSHMNLIQQENMAKALGMSREQMAKMLIMQEINKGLSAEQVANMTGMTRKSIEAISAQEKWKTITQEFLEVLVPLLEPVLQVVSSIFRLVSPILGVLSTITGWLSQAISWVAGLGNKISEDNMFLRAIPGILTAALVVGLKFVGVFAKIGTLAAGIKTKILSWIPGLAKTRVAAQEVSTVFDQRLNRGKGGWRDVKSGRIVKAPTDVTKNITKTATKTAPVSTGTSRMGKAVGGLGKNIANIAAGAAAAVLIAGAVFILAKAAQEFMKVSWGGILKAVAGMMTLVGAVAAVGAIMSSGVGTALVLAGAAAMVVMAGAVALLGLALKQFEAINWGTIGKLPVAMLSLAAAGALALVAGPALALGAPTLLAGSLALLAASYPLKRGLANLSAVPGSELKLVAEGITAIAGSVGTLVTSLEKVSLGKLTKLATLGKVFGALKGSQIYVERPKVRESVQVPTEESQESLGIQKENIEASVQEIVIKQAQVQASAQQISVEQKAADLSRIERKMDEIAKVFRESRPDWDWLKFDHEYSKIISR